jgi:hypothetical protein
MVLNPILRKVFTLDFVRKFPCGFVAVGQASGTQSFLVLHLVTFHVDYNKKLSV